MTPVLCDYCSRQTSFVRGSQVYPHRPDLHKLRFYMCRPCGAWVGVHRGTVKPLGRLADAALRRAKMDAHAAFDPLWKKGRGKRSSRYRWLADRLGIQPADCHIGMFDIATCERVVDICLAEALRLATPEAA
jgi:hypothetical protein